MTVAEAIATVDKLKPNQYSADMKRAWLSQLDGMIFQEVVQTHEGNKRRRFTEYDESSQDDDLLVPFPYDEPVYSHYLQAQIDRANGETGKYNQSITLYNDAFTAYQSWYNREHTPLPSKTRFLF